MKIRMEFASDCVYFRNNRDFRIRLFYNYYDCKNLHIKGNVGGDNFLKPFRNLIRRMKLEHVK